VELDVRVVRVLGADVANMRISASVCVGAGAADNGDAEVAGCVCKADEALDEHLPGREEKAPGAQRERRERFSLGRLRERTEDLGVADTRSPLAPRPFVQPIRESEAVACPRRALEVEVTDLLEALRDA
jgi:hypothetical protein